MGVEALNKFIKEKVPNCNMEIDISTLKGTKVAIDVALALNKFAFSAHNTLLSEMDCPADDYDPAFFTVKLKDLFMTFILNFLTRGITPVCIFDGPSDPEKRKCQVKRVKQKEDLKNKVEKEISEYKNKDPLEITSADDVRLLKTRGQYYMFGKNDFMYIENMLKEIGIPCFKAEHDGEKLCASLSLEQSISAVCTTDCDSQPLGVRIMISDVNFRGMSKMRYLDPLVRHFGYEFNCSSYEEAMFYLREFSIMCGCDFNEHIKGVGPAGVMKLLKAHRNIETVATVKDISCFNHIHCRKFFNYTPSNISVEELYVNWGLFDRNISLFKPKNDMYFDMNIQKIDRTPLTRVKITFENGI